MDSYTPGTFWIVNYVDKPCGRMIAICISSDGACRYIGKEDSKNTDLMFLDHDDGSTPLEDFGVFLIRSEKLRSPLRFRKSKPSVAEYSDGLQKKWQGEHSFSVEVDDWVLDLISR
jgi:hypothetical protein